MRSDRVDNALREIKTAMRLHGSFVVLSLIANAFTIAVDPDALRELRGYALELNGQSCEESEKD